MSIVFLGLGSNLGDKNLNLNQAIQLIGMEAGEILNISSFYESLSWGFESGNIFLNAVVVISTELTPLDLLNETQRIERKIGRKEKTKKGYADRVIDVDILFYDNQLINLPQLTIPHPHVHKRDFVLMPLSEIAPELVHPVLKKTMKQLCAEITDETTVLKSENQSGKSDGSAALD